MIYVDPQGPEKAKAQAHEMAAIIKRIGIASQVERLPFGDFAFEGKGPKGSMAIGLERKTLHDMLNCIDDAHYSAKQRVGMLQLYQKSYLIMEGLWKPHTDGFLMEGFNGGSSWGYCKYRSTRVMYSKLRRYLASVANSNIEIIYTRDIFQTAYDLCELWHYYQKDWIKHTSMMETQKIAVPSLNFKPSLTQRWAVDLEGIGLQYSQEADRLFRKPIALAQADELAWMRIPGIGAKTARKIIKEIQGWK